MSLPDEVPFDRRTYDDEDGANGRRRGYRRKEDMVRAKAVRKDHISKVLLGLAMVVLLAGIIAVLVISFNRSSSDQGQTKAERESRITNVSLLCNGINTLDSYIQLAVGKFKSELPPAPAPLKCASLIAQTAQAQSNH